MSNQVQEIVKNFASFDRTIYDGGVWEVKPNLQSILNYEVFSPKEAQDCTVNTPKERAEVGFDFRQLFERNSGIILNEKWTQSFIYDSKVVGVSKEAVVCECLMDRENKIFQTRTFPKSLFDHFSKLEIGKFVWIKILAKPGSTRVDVIDAKNSIDESAFDLHEGWENVKEVDFGKPIRFK